MGYEVEVKYRLVDHDQLEHRLVERGALHAKDAIELVLQSRHERGEPVPLRDGTLVRSVDVTAVA